MANPLNTPDSDGIYWARSKRSKWWNLIVKVYGDPPFLTVDVVWRWAEDQLVINRNMLSEVYEFGPKIETPTDPTLQGEEKHVY